MIQPPMNSDKRRLKTLSSFAFISVDLRPIDFFTSLLDNPSLDCILGELCSRSQPKSIKNRGLMEGNSLHRNPENPRDFFRRLTFSNQLKNLTLSGGKVGSVPSRLWRERRPGPWKVCDVALARNRRAN